MSTLIVKELRILFFSDRSLYLIYRLFHEHPVLHVQDPIGIALEFGVMCDHDTCGPGMLPVATGPDAVDIKQKIHDRDCGSAVQVARGLIQQ